MSLLTLHLYVGFAVCALALFAVWRRNDRRVTLYVVTLQIVLGIVLLVGGLRVPALHVALAVVGWAGYMTANAMARRGVPARNVLIAAGISSLLILIAFGIGQSAVRHALASP